MEEDDSPNQICLRTHKGEYYQGETVYGVVYLRVTKKVSSNGLKLKIRGYERAEFEYEYMVTEHTGSRQSVKMQHGKRSSKRDVLQVEYRLIEYPGEFPIGCFSYPFKFTLPDNIPGVFFQKHTNHNHGNNWEASIKYFIKAELEVTDNSKPLVCEEPLLIYGHTEASEQVTPEVYRSTDSVKTFCCIPRGDVEIKASLSKVAYKAGDKAFVHVEIVNNSAVEIRSFVLKVIRVIKLLGKDNVRNEEHSKVHCIIDTVAQSLHRGCKNNSMVSSGIPIQLAEVGNTETVLFPPSVKGTTVSCHYVVDIDMYIPWAPAIEMHLPLLIKPYNNIVWEKWTSPSWSQECKMAPVVAECVVTPDVIASDIFFSMLQTTD